VIDIYENYRGYEAPSWFRPTVDRLLQSLEAQHIAGLRSVVLSNSAAIGRGRTGRVNGRKYQRSDCLGFYHRSRRGEPPWIELIVDNIVSSHSRSLLRWQLFRDLFVAQYLYHEVGHHLHETVGSAAHGGEASADDWQERLGKLHGRKRYWYLRPLRSALRAAASILRRIAAAKRHGVGRRG
jgi:hypothetical protein